MVSVFKVVYLKLGDLGSRLAAYGNSNYIFNSRGGLVNKNWWKLPTQLQKDEDEAWEWYKNASPLDWYF